MKELLEIPVRLRSGGCLWFELVVYGDHKPHWRCWDLDGVELESVVWTHPDSKWTRVSTPRGSIAHKWLSAFAARNGVFGSAVEAVDDLVARRLP